jgi:type II secretory pathway pseudopilin PulG
MSVPATSRVRSIAPQARTGAVLLEVVVAVAILLMASITILGAVNQGVRSMERSRLAARAADLARSAMAEIEAGIATPESLSGPVQEQPPPPGSGDQEGTGVNAPGGDALPRDTGWELEIDVSPSPFAGLAKVSILAIKRPPGGDQVEASYVLHQLVRLSAEAEDRAGESGELTVESERGPDGRGQGPTGGEP